MIVRGRQALSFDPWTALAVVTPQTTLTLGPMITPVTRGQPWEFGGEPVTLDRVCHWRFIPGTGIEGGDAGCSH